MADWILSITFLAIVWYSWETRRLVRVTGKNLKVEIEPIIALEGVEGFWFNVKNIGRSPALNIKIQEIKNRRCSNSNDSYNIVFEDSNPFLRPNMTIGICSKFKLCGSTGHQNLRPSPFLEYRNPDFINGYEVIINFNDIEMGKWESRAFIDKTGIQFKGIKEIKK
jgi:hypothetical protein